MSQRGIGCDHEIQAHHDGRSVFHHRQARVHLVSEVDDGASATQLTKLLGPFTFLQVDKLDSRDPGQRLEVGQREGPVSIAAMPGIPLPGDPNLETWPVRKTRTPTVQRARGWPEGTGPEPGSLPRIG